MQKDKTRLNSIRVTTAGISGGGNSHRISYLDVVKGALIILLVFAHFRSALIELILRMIISNMCMDGILFSRVSTCRHFS